MHIGERIKAQRINLGWTQRQLAEKMGYKNHSVIARIERGTVDIPQSRLDQFAKVLGVSHAYLLGLITKEEHSSNNDIAFLTKKMMADSDFKDTVLALSKLTEKQYQSVKHLISAFDEFHRG